MKLAVIFNKMIQRNYLIQPIGKGSKLEVMSKSLRNQRGKKRTDANTDWFILRFTLGKEQNFIREESTSGKEVIKVEVYWLAKLGEPKEEYTCLPGSCCQSRNQRWQIIMVLVRCITEQSLSGSDSDWSRGWTNLTGLYANNSAGSWDCLSAGHLVWKTTLEGNWLLQPALAKLFDARI